MMIIIMVNTSLYYADWPILFSVSTISITKYSISLYHEHEGHTNTNLHLLFHSGVSLELLKHFFNFSLVKTSAFNYLFPKFASFVQLNFTANEILTALERQKYEVSEGEISFHVKCQAIQLVRAREMRFKVIYLIRIRERVIDEAVKVSVKLTSENDEYFANLNWKCISSLKSKARRSL